MLGARGNEARHGQAPGAQLIRIRFTLANWLRVIGWSPRHASPKFSAEMHGADGLPSETPGVTTPGTKPQKPPAASRAERRRQQRGGLVC